MYSSFLQLLVKIYRNQSLTPQQMQAIATNNTTTSPTNNNNNNSHSMYFVYPLLNYMSAGMLGKILTSLTSPFANNQILGSSTSSNITATITNRHYLACTYFVSPYQTVRSLADELAVKFGKSLEEIRIWTKVNEVSRLSSERFH